jgi:hypothetical protein
MKQLFLLPILLLAVSGWSATSEAFDAKAAGEDQSHRNSLRVVQSEQETVTLDLRDAKLTDVLTTLGAIANLPVVIEPGIEGKVTIKLENVPFAKILAMLSRDNGISVRVEDGKLVASRVPETPVAAPALPEKFREAPRILLADYASAAAAPPPLLVRVSGNGEEMCWIAGMARGGGLLEIPLSAAAGGRGVSDSTVLFVADMGYDPVSRTRVLAAETPGGSMKRTIVLDEKGSPVTFDFVREGKPLHALFSQARAATLPSDGECTGLRFRSDSGLAPVMVTMQADAISDGGATPVFAPRIQTTAGSVFKALGSESDSGSGRLRGYAVSGYVSRDGKSVAMVFKARAVWTDPEDGKQYYFTQGGDTVDFVPLTKPGVLASTVQPGVATARKLELRVNGQE